MRSEFSTPAGEVLLAEIKALFDGNRVFRRNDVPFVFVCGGPPSGNSMRKYFLQWAAKELPDVVTVLAEQAFADTVFHEPPKTYNLSVFEMLIADISDCVVLFPESPGAFAEMGYFSATKITSKVLIVNDLKYQARDSFANLGPINTFNHRSFLNPTLHVDASDPSAIDFSPIKDRLARLITRKKRKSLPYRSYSELTTLEKFLIILEIINLLHAVTLDGLMETVRVAFGSFKGSEIKQLLSILVGSGRVERFDDSFVLAKGARSGLEFEGVDIRDLRARVLLYYKRNTLHQYMAITSTSA